MINISYINLGTDEPPKGKTPHSWINRTRPCLCNNSITYLQPSRDEVHPTRPYGVNLSLTTLRDVCISGLLENPSPHAIRFGAIWPLSSRGTIPPVQRPQIPFLRKPSAQDIYTAL